MPFDSLELQGPAVPAVGGGRSDICPVSLFSPLSGRRPDID